MPTVPIAVNGTIVNDGETLLGSLREWLGLPRAELPQIARYGAHPRIGSPQRGGRSLGLEIALKGADVGAQRRALYRALDYERGTMRLVAGDDWVAGGTGRVSIYGPWDVYYDIYSAAWHVRDVVDPSLGGQLSSPPVFSAGREAGSVAINATESGRIFVAEMLPAESGSLALWWRPTHDAPDHPESHFVSSCGLLLMYDPEIRKIRFGDRTNVAESQQLGFAAGDWIHIVCTWGDGLALYIDGDLAGTAMFYQPYLDICEADPSVAADEFAGDIEGLVVVESQLEDVHVARLYGAALNPRWMAVVPQPVRALYESGVGLSSRLDSDGDTRWRRRDGDYVHYELDDDAGEFDVDNLGDDDAHPVFYLRPDDAKSAGQIYARWRPHLWTSSEGSGGLYPVMIGPLSLTGKAQADGDDIRVFVDGVEVDRWLGGTLVSSVRVWYNTTFEPALTMSLASGIDDAVTSLVVNGDISTLPVEGCLYVGTEAITYTARNVRTGEISGLTRGAKGTSAAAHSASATVHWVQHDVWVYYGDSAMTAPTVDDRYKPTLNLSTSTNESWVYAEFGDDDGLRTGAWVFEGARNAYGYSGGLSSYTGNRGASADPWAEMGVYHGGIAIGFLSNHWYLRNPCGIARVQLQNGEWNVTTDRIGDPPYLWDWQVALRSSPDGESWAVEDTLADPAAFDSWQNWSMDETPPAGTTYASLFVYVRDAYGGSEDYEVHVEVADAVVTLDAYPVEVAGDEQANYPLDLTIENQATGQSVRLTLGMAIGEVLVLDTDAKLIARADGSQLPNAIVKDTPRRDWLPLQPGVNPISLADAGTVRLSVDVVWDRRFYE